MSKDVSMGNCVGCNLEWYMSQGEKAFYDRMVSEKGFSLPRRCRECRKKRESQGQISIPLLVKEVNKLTKRVLNEEFAFNSADLAQELTDIASSLTAFMTQNARIFRKELNEGSEVEMENQQAQS